MHLYVFLQKNCISHNFIIRTIKYWPFMVRSHSDLLCPTVGEGGGHVPDQPATAYRQPTRRRRQTQAGGHFVLLIILTVYIHISVIHFLYCLYRIYVHKYVLFFHLRIKNLSPPPLPHCLTQ